MRAQRRADGAASSTRAPGGALALALLAGVSVSGCALLSKSDAVVLHYYSPTEGDSSSAASATVASASAPILRLGNVDSASHLREKVVFRTAEHEVGYYEDLRWTEKPEVYLRQAMTNALFYHGQLRRAVGGDAPSLDVELIAFEEIRAAHEAGRVTVRFVLHDEALVLLEGLVTVERLSAGGAPRAVGVGARAVVDTLAVCLRDVVAEVARRVVTHLSREDARAASRGVGAHESRP